MRTTRLDASNVTPEELPALSDDDFRRVVDADLRRRVSPHVLPEATSAALRDPGNVKRWHTTLSAILRSVEGQDQSAQDDFDHQLAELESRVGVLQDAGGQAEVLAGTYDKIDSLRRDYLSKKASRERFKTGVAEYVALAESLLNDQRDRSYQSMVTEERDRYATRMRRLERAIRRHRDAVIADLDEDDDPTDYEKDLWETLEVKDD